MNARSLALAVIALLLTTGAEWARGAAVAQETGTTATDAASGTATTSSTNPAASEPAKVEVLEGFRSARFGMSEDEVLAAIKQDFNIAEDQVSREPNPLEKTQALAVTVPDLIPDTGPARVAYILGHQTKKLIQVNVVWGAPVTKDYTVEQLASAASILRNYFAQRTYKAGTVFSNVALSDGTLVLFTASDEQGRQVTLTYREARAPRAAGTGSEGEAGGEAAQAGSTAAADAQTADQGSGGATAATTESQGNEQAAQPQAFLRLSYVANPAEPDVFRLPAGSF